MGLSSRSPGGGYRGALQRIQGREEKTEDDIADVLARLNETRDGQALLQWIYRQSHGRQMPEGAPEGALREQQGLNRFATTIFNLVDRGLTRNASRPKK